MLPSMLPSTQIRAPTASTRNIALLRGSQGRGHSCKPLPAAAAAHLRQAAVQCCCWHALRCQRLRDLIAAVFALHKHDGQRHGRPALTRRSLHFVLHWQSSAARGRQQTRHGRGRDSHNCTLSQHTTAASTGTTDNQAQRQFCSCRNPPHNTRSRSAPAAAPPAAPVSARPWFAPDPAPRWRWAH